MNLEAKLYKYQAHMLQRELPIYKFFSLFHTKSNIIKV